MLYTFHTFHKCFKDIHNCWIITVILKRDWVIKTYTFFNNTPKKCTYNRYITLQCSPRSNEDLMSTLMSQFQMTNLEVKIFLLFKIWSFLTVSINDWLLLWAPICYMTWIEAGEEGCDSGKMWPGFIPAWCHVWGEVIVDCRLAPRVFSGFSTFPPLELHKNQSLQMLIGPG